MIKFQISEIKFQKNLKNQIPKVMVFLDFEYCDLSGICDLKFEIF